MQERPFESTLVVFQNPIEGRQRAFDDWYTNIHLRDAMRLDTAIAGQRFIQADRQLSLGGQTVVPTHWAHTIYEWSDAAKCLQDHLDMVCTPKMEVSKDGDLHGIREYFGRAVYLSHRWNKSLGFRRGVDVLTAMIKIDPARQNEFIAWFERDHTPALLAEPGFASASLFALHEVQVLPPEFTLFAHYGLYDSPVALAGWEAAFGRGTPLDIAAQCDFAEVTCWQPRTRRMRPRDMRRPSAHAAAEEQRARAELADRFLTRRELAAAEFGDENALDGAAVSQ